VLGGRRKTKAGADRPAPSIKAIAVRLLARREYGRAELGARLRARGAAADEVERTLEDLAALGYLSDARFAEALVRSRSGAVTSVASSAHGPWPIAHGRDGF